MNSQATSKPCSRLVFASLLAAAACWLSAAPVGAVDSTAPEDLLWLECPTFRLGLAPDGTNLHFIDQATGKDYGITTDASTFAQVKVAGKWHRAARICRDGEGLQFTFSDCNARSTLKVMPHTQYMTVEVMSVEGDEVEELSLINMPLALTGNRNELFATCALALNLKMNVQEIPQPSSRLQASCYRTFGLEGAKVAIVGCAYDSLRDALKHVISESDELPKSTLGGPWALDARINYGSYLMDLRGEVVESTVDAWIVHCRNLGVTQLDFHTGHSLRFGDYRPNPALYPDGYASLTRVIDKLHAAGISAGLHTYAQFIAKDTPWVTPVPDPRLAKARTMTLTDDITTEATTIPIVESTAGISPITGFHVRNSATIQIDDELIVFKATSKEAPYQFQQCQRGAHGTQVAPHTRGATVHHLKECFGLFAPDPDTTLYSEVAEKTAEAYNRCGFDMIYLDAIDGSDIFAGWPDAWHYSARFIYDLADRLERPALFEMSMFLHHFWCVRSRIGAWDIPARGAKSYIDMHTMVNESFNKCFLPAQLGWWGTFQWNPLQPERTFPEILDYICCKSIGYDSGLSFLVGFSQSDYEKSANMRRMSELVRRYEALRLSRAVPDAVREKLRIHGDEYALTTDVDGRWRFQPRQYVSHKVLHNDERTCQWTVDNRFGTQQVAVRVEALMSAAAYDDPGCEVIADFADPKQFSNRQSRPGVSSALAQDRKHLIDGQASGHFSATNDSNPPHDSWTMAGKEFAPYLNMVNKGLGVWVHGDGRGELINLQLQNPAEHVSAFRDGHIKIDFTGWRYFELIEPESDRIFDYGWPYSIQRSQWHTPENRPVLMQYAYPTCHFWMKYDSIQWLNIYANNIVKNSTIDCRLGPVKAIPLITGRIARPSITVADTRMTFPVQLDSGSYVEFHPPSDCRVYNALGEETARPAVEGDCPRLTSGDNIIRFDCTGESSQNWRGRVTLITRGESIE